MNRSLCVYLIACKSYSYTGQLFKAFSDNCFELDSSSIFLYTQADGNVQSTSVSLNIVAAG